jgi:hypothetical protein
MRIQLGIVAALGFTIVATVAGCPETSKPDGYCAPGTCPADGGGDGGVGGDASVACGGACSGATPYCKESTNTCVECLQTEQCTDGTKSVCDTSTNTCVACNDNTQCSHIAGKGICDQGTCVGCTEATEAAACGGFYCDPAAKTCTTMPRGTLGSCRACTADAECAVGYRCVPMNFQGTARPGGYCLLVSSGTNCVEPYRVLINGRASLSQPTDLKNYCGIAEDTTTCEAVLHLINNQGCTGDADCGATGLNDGLCRTVAGAANKCTYACAGPAQCPSVAPTCNNPPAYCGN